MEIAAQDPVKGAMFYTLSQPDDSDPSAKIKLHREERCLDCHVSSATLSIPGDMVRSIQVDEFRERDPQGLSAEVTHTIPYEKRWGGWYVTGHSPNMIHAGNLFGDDDFERHEKEPAHRGTTKELSPVVNLSEYPSKQSEIVALTVLDHQMHFYNLLTRVQYECRLGHHSDAEEQLARYAMMEVEARLAGAVEGSTEFSNLYQSRKSEDSNGISLRELNLKTQLFEHRLSPLVHSRSFQSLPADVQTRFWNRVRSTRGDEVASVSTSEIAEVTVTAQSAPAESKAVAATPAQSCQTCIAPAARPRIATWFGEFGVTVRERGPFSANWFPQ